MCPHTPGTPPGKPWRAGAADRPGSTRRSLDTHPKLQAWYVRLLERPAVQTEMRRLLGASRG
jgi:glutathione S-transferase